MQVGYHASHEQFAPSHLLQLARQAEETGFDAVLSSDHITPWSMSQDQSGFAWSWLGAAAVATSLPLAVVTAPGYRYHPAVTAQAIATVAELAPGRFTPALGSGQALNEHVTGGPWPLKPERNARLAECAAAIRRLLAGETVDHDGLITLRRARVHSLPAQAPPLFAAALTPETAREVADWADGLITVNSPAQTLGAVIDAFREGGGAGKPIHVQMHLSWAASDEEAENEAVDQWRANALPPTLNEELETPEQLDAASRQLSADDLRDSVLMSADLERHAEAIAGLDRDFGIERVYLHQVGTDQEKFIEAFGDDVVPRIDR